MLLGVISDTHGLMRPQALAALRGCDLIIHAGDVGTPDVLAELRRIAPVFAVRGNIDTQRWAQTLPYTRMVSAGAHNCHVLHDISQLAIDPGKARIAAVIFGHSHKPSVDRRDGVLYLNPGSAGPRRFTLPICVARIRVSEQRLEPTIVHLQGEQPRSKHRPAGGAR
jgi:putative phosphoesterase